MSTLDHVPAGSDQRSARHYRADIDGLRALAVLPVIAFHLGFQHISGGYVGVDVFFVISGYLIGGMILGEVGRGGFSIVKFYEKRFRRILPALIAMITFCTIASAIILFPKPLADYAKSLIATALSASNFLFYAQSGYFDAASDTKPLLHTWSLAVEEQFYFLFPLLVIALRRQTRILDCVLAALIIGSLLLSIMWVRTDGSAAFYLPPSRAWELLLGVIGARLPSQILTQRWWREGGAAVGLALILAPMLLYTSKTPFPGLAAIPPCLGAWLILVCGAQGSNLTSRMLALRPATAIGLISYSLYLWHWPIIVLTKEYLPASSLTMAQRFIALAVAIGLSWFSWAFIERPFRSPLIRRRTIFGFSALTALLMCAVGIVGISTNGLPQRFSPDVLASAALIDDFHATNVRRGTCFITSMEALRGFNPKACFRVDRLRPNVLVIGDSHGAHLWAGLNDVYPNINFQQATASGCQGTIHQSGSAEPSCKAIMRYAYTHAFRSRPDAIILAASWNADDELDVIDTLKQLKSYGLEVVLAGPIVRYNQPLPSLVARSIERRDVSIINQGRRADSETLDTEFRSIAGRYGAIYFSQYRALCATTLSSCKIVGASGRPLQYDYGHVTQEGADLVALHFPKSLIQNFLSRRSMKSR